MRAEVALGDNPSPVIEVQGLEGTGLEAGFTPDTGLSVEIDDAVGSLVQSARRTDRHAGRAGTLVTAEDGEVSFDIGEGPRLHILHPGSEDPDGDLILLLARHRT